MLQSRYYIWLLWAHRVTLTQHQWFTHCTLQMWWFIWRDHQWTVCYNMWGRWKLEISIILSYKNKMHVNQMTPKSLHHIWALHKLHMSHFSIVLNSCVTFKRNCDSWTWSQKSLKKYYGWGKFELIDRQIWTGWKRGKQNKGVTVKEWPYNYYMSSFRDIKRSNIKWQKAVSMRQILHLWSFSIS